MCVLGFACARDRRVYFVLPYGWRLIEKRRSRVSRSGHKYREMDGLLITIYLMADAKHVWKCWSLMALVVRITKSTNSTFFF